MPLNTKLDCLYGRDFCAALCNDFDVVVFSIFVLPLFILCSILISNVLHVRLSDILPLIVSSLQRICSFCSSILGDNRKSPRCRNHFFLCKHLGTCTQKMTEMPRSTKLAKFATVHNIFTTVQTFFTTVNRKVYCANFFFLLCKKVLLSEISASRKILRGGPNTPSNFFVCYLFGISVSASRTFFCS